MPDKQFLWSMSIETVLTHRTRDNFHSTPNPQVAKFQLQIFQFLYSPNLPPDPGVRSLIQPAFPSPAHLFSPVQYLISPSAPMVSCSRYKFVTSTFSGLSKPGSLSSCWIALIVLLRVYVGAQCSLVKSVRHISPDWKCTFGWQIGVLKATLGGDRG